MGMVLMGEIMMQETAAELCHPTQGGGVAGFQVGLRMSRGASHGESGGVQDRCWEWDRPCGVSGEGV